MGWYLITKYCISTISTSKEGKQRFAIRSFFFQLIWTSIKFTSSIKGRKNWGVGKHEQELETLKSTWKVITDDRTMPTTRHYTGGNLQHPRKMIKFEIFNQQPSSNQNNISKILAGSFGWGKLSGDPFLG
ncbi:hypothetical protein ACET3Z_003106 [Daucus carota]